METHVPKISWRRAAAGLRHRTGLFVLCMAMLLTAPVCRAAAADAAARTAAGQRKIEVSGTVRDKAGKPLPGAHVLVPGHDALSTTTHSDGTFRITVPEGSVLEISFLGYLTKRLSRLEPKVEIILEEDAKAIDDVVVMGYSTQSMRDVSASVSKIDMKAIANNPSVSLATMLAGQAAGLQTVTRSGVPGASGTGLVIRGNNSLLASNDITGISNPLYIVDGIPMALQDLAGYNVTDNDFLSSLNPQDIQSINILKDAAATAIYGSRGANGVVIITTRKGTSGEPRVTARISVGVITKPGKLPVYIGDEERQAKLGLIERTLANFYGDLDWIDLRNGMEVLGYALPAVLTDKYNPAFNNAYDFQDMFYRNGVSQNYDLSMEGGSANNSYRVSIGHYRERGVLVGYGLNRTNLSASLVTDINRWLHNEFVLRYSFLDRKGGLNDQMKAMPTAPTELPSSLYYRTPEELRQMSGQLGDAYNKNQSHNISLGETLRFQLADGISWDNQVSAVMDFGSRNYFIPTVATTDDRSKVYSSNSLTTTINANSVVNFNRSFGRHADHTVIGLLGVELNSTVPAFLRAQGEQGISDYLKVLQSYKTEHTTAYSDIVKSNMLSFFALLSYGFRDNKYKVEGVFRRDASSRFGSNNKWANFPSVKAHWAFTREPWMEWSRSFLDFGKVRVSYGSSGDIYYDPLLQYNSLVALSALSAGLTGPGSNKMNVGSYGGQSAILADFNKVANKSLSWSRSKEIDYGIDLEMFGRRLNITADIYSKYMSGLVYTSKLPEYLGYSQIQSNLVDMVSHGFELAVTGYLWPRDSEIQWDWTLNLSNNRSKIAKLGNGGRDYIDTNGYYAFIEGAPAFQYYMYEYLGTLDRYSDLPVDPFTGKALAYTFADAGLGRNLQGRIFPGMPIFADANGDYLVDGMNTGTDYKIIEGKTPEPKIMGGLHTGFRYKNLSVRVSTSFSFGNWIFNTTLQQQLSRFDSNNSFYRYALYKFDESQFWQRPDDGSKYPMLWIDYSDGGSARSFRISSMFLERGDYWSIDNVNISYNLPKRWVNRLNMRGLNVYLTGSNLYMWKASEVLDPRQISRTGWYNGSGYPVTPTFTLGVQLQF